METQERDYVLGNLATSEARLRTVTQNLTPEQWHFHENPERWSIAQNLDHCVMVENAIFAVIERSLAGPKQPEKKAEALAREGHVKAVDNSKGREIPAPEQLCPTPDRTDTETMLTEFGRLRARSTEFANTTDAELRDHFFPHHILGDLDCYQWLVVLSQHAARHAGQIEQIKRDPAFPGRPPE